MRVRIRDIVRGDEPKTEELARYLQGVHLRFRNGIHAQTRVYTCRVPAEPFELHWNDHEVPGERHLASFGFATETAVAAAEAELRAGRAVRLFIFNSDADLCFQEQLSPA